MAVFRTRARTVDMLGRQQIAGVPTAISEVFKNAHDAYAKEVRADLLVDSRCLMIRDDGIGMTPTQFEQNWLTLATDNKAAGRAIQPPRGMKARPVLGAKGIGRLAIALVGPHTLVLTKSRKRSSDLVVAFVNWSMFEAPEIDLDQVEVPIVTIPGTRLPTSAEVGNLVSEARKNVRALLPAKSANPLLASLDQFDSDAIDLLAALDGPQLTGKGHGTHFVIAPLSDDTLDEAASGPGGSDLTTSLVGFADTMTPGHPEPDVNVSLWVHERSNRGPEDVLSATDFLSEEDFWSADHQIVGEFDERGTFAGEVRVFGGAPVTYQLKWSGATGLARCGPFGLSFAVLQGTASDSQLKPLDHQQLAEKLGRMGGIYVYRDSIRVLPYGRPDFDWLDMEQARSKNLAKAFYSHRRVFGAVRITNDSNSGLHEKAGREGFQQNPAYKHLRSILQGFLRASAKDFFVKGGLHADEYADYRDSVKRRATARKQREREVSQARLGLEEELVTAYLRITDGVAASEVLQAVRDFEMAAEHALAGDAVNPLEVEQYLTATKLRDTQRSLVVDPPPRLGLTRELKRDLASLRIAIEEFEETVLVPARQRIDAVAGETQPAGTSRKPTTRVLAEMQNRLGSSLQDAQAQTLNAVTELQARAEALIAEVTLMLREGIERLQREDSLAEPDRLLPEDYIGRRTSLEHGVDDLYARGLETLAGLATSIDRIEWHRDGNNISTSADMTASIDEDIAELRRSADESLDLVQLGMTLSIVDHEFQLIIRSIRQSLRELRSWADLNPSLGPLVDDLGLTFEHLDSYLTLFTPLQRRMNRRKTLITGDDIFRFVNDMFRERLEADEIEFGASDPFLKFDVRGFRSTWYPVFVNLVDNAIYWVGTGMHPRHILLDFVDGAILVSDTGPGVSREDVDLIFEARFSLKPAGRGLGLAISKEVLELEGYELGVQDDEGLGGAAFVIRKTAATGRT